MTIWGREVLHADEIEIRGTWLLTLRRTYGDDLKHGFSPSKVGFMGCFWVVSASGSCRRQAA
ncbi:hypothetical protein CH63R_09724 [Colletotrichum higginsianum IMI 349063]|uniref:Uncharacterized protein n=1 Tax=Colletotrichum higginsianum (strain IMI 349063) TaxID=759273 RepID=A0A1B7Y0S2_COLHI|nr:uncharacterized protein CH63R_09724 [Colletotrichum higginsianum IMI 349063]OBR05604.1 hypothetical protein CH63R_09724 [Colletotrichum higginsianum IMI 349063]